MRAEVAAAQSAVAGVQPGVSACPGAANEGGRARPAAGQGVPVLWPALPGARPAPEELLGGVPAPVALRALAAAERAKQWSGAGGATVNCGPSSACAKTAGRPGWRRHRARHAPGPVRSAAGCSVRTTGGGGVAPGSAPGHTDEPCASAGRSGGNGSGAGACRNSPGRAWSAACRSSGARRHSGRAGRCAPGSTSAGW